ncbi:MAG TPA: YegS/Rv2252/BmrU family lipid kinase [Gemmatimonadales bacterium]|nr:YegS/Rv2252/BmrU family lipid kinase [Gemmatimonadales bacterium]
MALTGALAVSNPVAAGGAAARAWSRLVPQVDRRFPSLAVRVTTAPGDAERWALEWAAAHPGRPVIAVGGDGTVHEVLNGLLRGHPSASLGIIPAGTGNDVARNTGVPINPEGALERIFRNRPTAVDAARVRFQGTGAEPRTRLLLNSISVGVSPRANHIAGRIRRALPGRFRYAISGILALAAEGAGEYTVTAGGRTLYHGRALNLTLANGASFGGGMRISPGSTVSDGMLDLVVIGAIGRIRALIALSRLYAGTHVQMGGVSVTAVGETVQIRRADGPMLIEADGEEFEARAELSVEILRGAVQLL